MGLLKSHQCVFNRNTLLNRTFRILLTLIGVTSGKPSRCGGGAPRAPPIYLSRLWADSQNSFVWWKLVKILIDFYSIGNFLSFTIWPLDVAKVTKVTHINIFKEKVKFCNFCATSMLYTSKERIFHVEFKFKQKSRVHYWKIWKKSIFPFFGSKMRLTRCVRWLISRIFWQQNWKMTLPGVVKRFELKSHQIWAHYL